MIRYIYNNVEHLDGCEVAGNGNIVMIQVFLIKKKYIFKTQIQ